MNYEAIKALAKQQGCKVTDLIALAPQNDPFYVGTPGDLEKGAWFADLWQRFNFLSGVHIRRVHYRIISQEVPILMPNGKPYENTETCWDFLNQASKMARYLNLVDPAAFVDRRNPEPHVYLYARETEPSINIQSDHWDASSFPSFPELPDYGVDDYTGDQRYHIEIWCEKSTMNDVLLPLCSHYSANLVTGVGEMSITAVLELTQRMNHRPVRIFYVSDFDPAGQSMPCAVSRKIEYFLREDDIGADVKLFPVVLTIEQVRAYRLPRTPIKESESRGAAFEGRYGSGAVELDALEALYPGELRNLLRAEIDRYFDHSLDDRVFSARAELDERLDEIRQDIIDNHSVEIHDLRIEYESIRAEFDQRMRDYGLRVGRLWQAISDELEAEAPDIDDHPIPEPDQAPETDIALFDTGRDYIRQLMVYKEWQGKPAEAIGEVRDE
jgi:hypothetical protein